MSSSRESKNWDELERIFERCPCEYRLAGKHIYYGRPLNRDTDEAARTLDAAERRGIPYNVAQLYRRLAESLRENNAVGPGSDAGVRVPRTRP